ncbi:MAG TPA: single-stranded DNA-binding protein [Ktedonobacteraceae bacterium]|nr:single-stranded DNA-binding protein [Ktedonobacteraceae bacterium]
MLNKIMLIGNLGKDPDFNVTSDGTPVAKFSLAVNRYMKSSSGEKKEETEWFNIVAWRQLAEICEKYLHKGSKVYIEGRVQQRKYTDREGVQRTTFEVIANEMQMLDSKAASGGSGNYAASGSSSGRSSAPSDDFDPFLDEDSLP